jgi:hypothetical protein
MFALKRSCCVFLLLLISSVGNASAASFRDFVSGLMQTIPGVLERKSLSFFSHFGTNLNRNKMAIRLDCNYDDPVRRKLCPPIVANPFPPNFAFPVEDEAKASATGFANESDQEAVRESVETEVSSAFTSSNATTQSLDPLVHSNHALAQFARCLEDPDDPECRELHRQNGPSKSFLATDPPSAARADFRTLRGLQRGLNGDLKEDVDDFGIATLAPTKDDCYGNMVDERFCASSMPSSTTAPTDIPLGNPLLPVTPVPTSCVDREDGEFIMVQGKQCSTYETLPIEVVRRGEDTVTFTVAQTWKEAPVAWVAAAFIEMGSYSCAANKEVSPLEEFSYTAQCNETGYVHIDIFVTDDSFADPDDRATVPEECAHAADPLGNTCAYSMVYACSCGGEGGGVYITPSSPTISPAGQPSTITSSEPSEGEPSKFGTHQVVEDRSVDGEPSPSPSLMPGEALTDIPFGALSDSPGVVPSALPTSAPTVCEDREDSRLQLVHGKTCEFVANPVVVVSRTGRSVTFTVNQTWQVEKDDVLEYIFTQFSKGDQETCDLQEQVPPYTELTYTVDCDISGVAEVNLFIADEAYDKTQDTAELPAVCSSEIKVPIPANCQFQVALVCGCGGSDFGSIQKIASDPPFAAPTATPTSVPTVGPTTSPTKQPTTRPSVRQTDDPSDVPSGLPAIELSMGPSTTSSTFPTKGGEKEPNEALSSVPSGSLVPSGSFSEGPAARFTSKPSSGPTNQPSSSPSETPSSGPTGAPTAGPTDGPTSEPTLAPSSSPISSPTAGPTGQPTDGPTSEASFAPSGKPVVPLPEGSPTAGPTVGPTGNPALIPTVAPTSEVSSGPSPGPTSTPTASPTAEPSLSPTSKPTSEPTLSPTWKPTSEPTSGPTFSPSSEPSAELSATPTTQPSQNPTRLESAGPSSEPTLGPTFKPTGQPSHGPTSGPTESPSVAPSDGPTEFPSTSPSGGPTDFPSASPSGGPTDFPSASPSVGPSRGPSSKPSSAPTNQPSNSSTSGPTGSPTGAPTKSPTGGPTGQPSTGPSARPSTGQTAEPSSRPIISVSSGPSMSASSGPTSPPTATPSVESSQGPSASPSAGPSLLPSSEGSSEPSIASRSPSSRPSPLAGSKLTDSPFSSPSSVPSSSVSFAPTASPSGGPTSGPSSKPSSQPSGSPSGGPSGSPSSTPSGLPSSGPTSLEK